MSSWYNPYKLGMNARSTALKLGQSAKATATKLGSAVGSAVRRVLSHTDAASKLVNSAARVRDIVRGVNDQSFGLLEEAVRALPFGDQAVRAGKALSRGIDTASGVIRKVRRGAQTVERVRNRAQAAVNQFT